MTKDITNTQYQQPLKPNPALKDLEVFVGDWDMEVWEHDFDLTYTKEEITWEKS